MTTVVAVAHGGKVTVGADRCTNVYDRPVVGISKVRRYRPTEPEGAEFVIGFAGAGALPAVLDADLQMHPAPARTDDDEAHQRWADQLARDVTELAELAHCFEDGKLDANLVLGYNGRLWTIAHMQAIPHADGRAAVGSGEGPALGAVDAGLALGQTNVPKLVDLAVRIAVNRDRFSEGEPEVVTIGYGPTVEVELTELPPRATYT